MHALSAQRRESEDAPEYWITYSDLMVSLLMVFALLLLIAIGKVQTEIARGAELIRGNKAAIRSAAAALEGSGTRITLDSATGSLTMDAEVLFDFRSAVLRPEAHATISQLATAFLPALLSRPAIDTMLQEIVIEGHTDTVGTYMYNLDLSQRRAFAVMQALVGITDSLPFSDRVRALVSASGKSEVRPILLDGQIEAARSRRIVIYVRFRDDAILSRIIDSTAIAAGARR